MRQRRLRTRIIADSCAVAVASISITALPACGNSDEFTAMAQKKPLGAGSPAAANKTLEEAVSARLAADARLRGAAIEVRGDVTRNAVTLNGAVASEELRRRAVELAREAQAGVLVDDRLEVKARDSR